MGAGCQARPVDELGDVRIGGNLAALRQRTQNGSTQGRQGALSRRVVDVGAAVREGAKRRGGEWVDHVLGDAGLVQPAQA
jgi:hypothetical protein